MPHLDQFNPNTVGNPNNNIFGLPSNEAESLLVVLPVPWEVTVSYGAGTLERQNTFSKPVFK